MDTMSLTEENSVIHRLSLWYSSRQYWSLHETFPSISGQFTPKVASRDISDLNWGNLGPQPQSALFEIPTSTITLQQADKPLKVIVTVLPKNQSKLHLMLVYHL